MKLVIAVIQPAKLNAVREALEEIEVTRMTICDAQDFARQGGQLEIFLGDDESTPLLRKIVLEVVVNDDFLQRTVETIGQAARTGSEGVAGDGNIFIVPADKAIQISDGSRGPSAV